MSTTHVRPANRRRTGLLQSTRALLGLFGAFKLYGTAYFTFFATAEQRGDPQGVGDWLVVNWSTALALAFLAGAVRLGAEPRRTARLLGAVVVADLAFSAVKFTVYDEPEAVAFMAVSLVVLGLVTSCEAVLVTFVYARITKQVIARDSDAYLYNLFNVSGSCLFH